MPESGCRNGCAISAMCTSLVYQWAGKGQFKREANEVFLSVHGADQRWVTRFSAPRSRTQNSVAPATAAGIIRMLTTGISSTR